MATGVDEVGDGTPIVGEAAHGAVRDADIACTASSTSVLPSVCPNVAGQEVAEGGQASVETAGLGIESNENAEVPKVGKTFHTEEDAYVFYNQYAKAKGFSVRRGNSVKNKAGHYRHRIFVCSRQGKTDDTYQRKIKDSEPRTCERNRGETRCMCQASMSIRRVVKGNGWLISKFVEEHTHPLATPRKVQFLTSHRVMPKSKKKLADQLSQANVPLCQQFRIMEVQEGGPSSVGFCEKDLRNYKRDLRRELLGHDAESLIFFFEKEKSRNPHSYYAYHTETVEIEEGNQQKVFKRCFWADCESRNAFAYFGDVLVFDTTYNTNAYSMILGTFVGVNHHRQTVVFGSGLLSDETTDSFRWLFSEFLACMPNRVTPKIIITDQDQAIGKAVSELLPNTMHRLCLWHIENKFSEKLGVALFNEHKGTIFSLIKDSETVEDFEKGWGALMSTTQLGERFVISQNSLADFIVRYWMAIEHQRNVEMQSSYIDWAQVPRSMTSFPMEKQMASIYTKTSFLRFQGEFQNSLAYKLNKISASEDRKVYEVRRVVADGLSDRVHTLTCLTGSDFVTCSCKLFEFHGYPCRHILRLLLKKDITYLPQQYILERWTKKAKSKPVFDEVRHIGPEQTLVSRRSTLASFAMEMVHEAAISQDISNFALTEMIILRRKIREHIEAGAGAAHPPAPSTAPLLNVADPILVRTKGSSKRLKSSKEKATEKKKKCCSHCKAPGHTIRTCPNLQSRSQLVDGGEDEDDAYHPDMSFMEGGVQSSLQDNFGMTSGLDEYNDTMQVDGFINFNC